MGYTPDSRAASRYQSLKSPACSSVSVPQGIAQKAPPSKPFERFDGCVLEPDEWTDGDSFRVRLPDSRLETTTGSRSCVSKKQNARVSFGLYEPRSYTTFFR